MLFNKLYTHLGLALFIAIISTSCGLVDGFEGNSHIDSINGRISPAFTGVAEKAYCGTPIFYGSTVTITGSATYQERTAFDTGPSNGLSSPSVPINIRYAEIEVVNSSGTRVQCAETDGAGNFSFNIPASTSTYKIYINSRANNLFAKVSVLNMPEQNIHYSISKSFTPNSSQNIGTINASANGDVVGAAFHILDLVVSSNDFLRSEVGTCAADIDNCINFTVADKVDIYWEKGFNPNSYFGNPGVGLSFYLPNYSRLFILGGINGDVDSSDTDHFDDTIVIHEYGHFLEDRYSTSDSPGGAHTGKNPIDPRLAFSEAWGNFFQAAVNYGASSTAPMYIDTSGNVDGFSTSYLLDIPLEQTEAGCSQFIPGCDEPTEAGEGNFREFAITRFLWDIFDTNNDGEAISGTFNEVWASITSGNGYISGVDSKFRSAGLFHAIQQNLSDDGGSTNEITDWSTARNYIENEQLGDRDNYAQKITTLGGCSGMNFNIVPFNDPLDTDEFISSNLFKNNDFYYYKQTVGGPATIELNYLTNTGLEADLDLFIYNESAQFGITLDMMGKDNGSPSTGSVDTEQEIVSLSNLPAGNYLINVKVKTHHTASVGGSTDYNLKIGGTQLCP